MAYYSCPIEELYNEIRRRGFVPSCSPDQLSEGLKKDEETRGAEATTIRTEHLGPFVPRELNVTRTAEFGHTAPAGSLVNERIIYWTMNTFFPTLQLFFESGLSCTIEGTRLPSAAIGLDPRLRFRLTDCTHDEDGRLTKSTLPEKFARWGTGLVIKEAIVARRRSITVKPAKPPDSAYSSPGPPLSTIAQESHIVIGLRLEGMSKMAYVWAKVKTPSEIENRIWGDVRIAGLRRDVPAPLLGYPERSIKPGCQTAVVLKNSMISGNVLEDRERAMTP